MRLVDPNGFPQVFIGAEPSPPTSINLPSLGDLQGAVKQDEASVVKVEGQGCGSIVEGAGFVAGALVVATSVFVVVGSGHVAVEEGNVCGEATVRWCDRYRQVAVVA